MPDGLTVMVVDAGARGHVLSTVFEKSPQVKKVVIAPGNDYMTVSRNKEVVTEPASSLKDANSLLEVAKQHRVDLVEVAQDDALEAGTVDLMQKHGIAVLGPRRDAARIEWDKRWSREFMTRQGIPTPEYRYFQSKNADPAKAYAKELYAQNPERLLFIKATGLIGGKGALPASTLGEAEAAISQMQAFGAAGDEFLIEEGLIGEEYSYYAMTDGTNFQTFKSAQDNKRVYDGDKGGQTGGIGAVAPALVTEGIREQIEAVQIAPAVTGLSSEGTPYLGLLYLGGIKTADGLNTIEYNARWGDPEVQVVLPGVQNDYVEVVEAALNGRLDSYTITEDDKVRMCVVGCSKGYPDDYSAVKGKEIKGLDDARAQPGIALYSAAIKVDDGKYYANGGRLFSVVGEGKDLLEARDRAYDAIKRISVEGDGLHYRTDIGRRDLARLG